MANIPYPENGDVWINADQKALKYHINNVDRTLLPQDWFTAGTPIEEFEVLDKPGYVVSLIEQGGAPRVVRTDSKTTQKTIGINLNAAGEGEAVEVQRIGLYYYDWINPPFQSSDIGKIAYVKDTPDGQITTDKNAAVLDGNNLIIIGQVISERELLISIAGDGRGPTDYSEIEYTTGEEIDTTGDPVLVCIKEDGLIYKASKHISPERYNVVGFIVGVSTLVSAGTRVVVLRSGKLIGFSPSSLTPGLPVYASGTDIAGWGTITQNPASLSPYYDKIINVGHAYSSDIIITNIIPSYSSYDDTKIGSIILCDATKTEPDTGFLFMNGATYNAVTHPQYQDLYNVIGNTWGGTNNTNFVLGNLNVGALKYQIKFRYFYQKTPLYTPVYRIEYPTSTTWQAYDNTDKNINITSFGFVSQENMKEIDVAVYARKGTITVKIPDLFTVTTPTPAVYGYNIEYIDTNNVRLNIASGGLAYINNSNVVTALTGDWQIKIILTKNERYNNYRDTDADMKLNYIYAKSAPIFDEIGSDAKLIALYDFDTYTTGNIVLDNSGFNVHGTPYNLSSIAGVISKGVSFNGSTSYFDTGTINLQSSSKFSIAFWNRVTSLTNISTIIRWGLDNARGIVMRRILANASGEINLYLNRGSARDTVTIPNFFSTTWAFYCIEINNTPNINTYSIWKNNNVLASGTYINTMVMPLITDIPRFGQYNNTEWMNGSIDELRIYNDTLSIEEKNFLYELGKMNVV